MAKTVEEELAELRVKYRQIMGYDTPEIFAGWSEQDLELYAQMSPPDMFDSLLSYMAAERELTCGTCEGKGTVDSGGQDQAGHWIEVACPACGGDGKRHCWWTEMDGGEGWSTNCGNAFVLLAGTPTENGFKYCTYCGLPLLASGWQSV